jgi:hypothetical protein
LRDNKTLFGIAETPIYKTIKTSFRDRENKFKKTPVLKREKERKPLAQKKP